MYIFFLGACSMQTGSSDSTTLSSEEVETYTKKGQEIALATFQVLSTKLKATMKEGGVQKAVNYCNVAAYPLTDSLSRVHQATIKRTALRLRNPKNTPDTLAQRLLNAYSQDLEQQKALKPIVEQLSSGKVAFFAPIIAQGPCLKCHGTLGKELALEDYAVIKTLYPEDQAINFQAGDLRGMWYIEFKK